MLFILSYRFYIDIFSNSTLCKNRNVLLDRKIDNIIIHLKISQFTG